ncbi:MAG: acetyl ornithine aminotransferase family protein [Candidatus Eisenbacteria bacterium]|nr:acetyl ornithine aminotransferase family protein [Candidatus Eisenbacteria bacterium]
MRKQDAPRLVTKLPGRRARMVVNLDKEHISPSYTRTYPLVVEKAEGIYLWDVDGNRFIDFNAGIAVCSTGHRHPKVVRAIQNQLGKFLHMSGTDFYYTVEVELAKALGEITPGNFRKKTFLSNSGTEAVEASLKLARYKTRRQNFIAFFGAFHGRSMGSLSLTASKAIQRKGFFPLMPGVTHVPYADCHRCVFNLVPKSCDFACVSYIEDVVFKKLVPGEEVAAFFVEAIQGEGGYIVPPFGYHQRVKKLAEKYGILFIADEVQSGMGRTGKMFAIEHWKVVPDIMALAKGIASGLPLGATVASAKVMDWPPGSHGNTFGGNPVSCVSALATIELLRDGLVENARRVGEFVKDSLEEIAECHPAIGWVSGLGLMLGVEIVSDTDRRKGDPAKRDAIVQECFERGLLILPTGPSAIRFSPPLVVKKAQAEIALEIFERAVSKVESRKR